MAVESCLPRNPKGVESFLRKPMDGSDLRRLIPLIDRAGMSRFEDKLSHLGCRDRNCEL